MSDDFHSGRKLGLEEAAALLLAAADRLDDGKGRISMVDRHIADVLKHQAKQIRELKTIKVTVP
jgi:hypothetical protein